MIVTRVIHQDPDLTDVQSEEEDIVTVFQFEHYFMDCCRSVSCTVVCSVTWPLNGSEAGGHLVLIHTSLLLLCKSSCSNAN